MLASPKADYLAEATDNRTVGEMEFSRDKMMEKKLVDETEIYEAAWLDNAQAALLVEMTGII